MSKEAMKRALEALQSGEYWKGVAAVNALREALAEQPAQQWQSTADKCELEKVPANGSLLPAQQEPMPCCGKYETCTQACTPRGRFLGKREALANEALDKMAENARELGLDYEPAQQEPVAKYSDIVSDGGLDPRNTAPPQRTWVGLTDEEVVDLKMLGRDLEFVSMTALRRFARDIAQTLKEKNT